MKSSGVPDALTDRRWETIPSTGEFTCNVSSRYSKQILAFAKFFHNCSTPPNPLVCQIGNYTLPDLHVQYRKYPRAIQKISTCSIENIYTNGSNTCYCKPYTSSCSGFLYSTYFSLLIPLHVSHAHTRIIKVIPL